MSLKARFRVAIVTLAVAIVAVMSALYVGDFLGTSFSRTADVAQSITGTVQASISDRLAARLAAQPDPPSNIEDARNLWLELIGTDPAISAALTRASGNWHQVAEVYIADQQGRVRASSMPGNVGQLAPPAVSFEEWRKRNLLANLRQVLAARENMEFVRALGSGGTPVVTIHVVMSSLFVRNNLMPKLENIGWAFLYSLAASVCVALMLPGLVLAPLERLGRRIDMMASGSASGPAAPVPELKEFAVVHSKLNALGQQVDGARQDMSTLRGNVAKLLQQLQEAVLLFDTSGRLMMAGEPARRFLDADPESCLGRLAAEMFPPSTPLGTLLVQALEKREPIRDRLVMLRMGQAERHVMASIEPLPGRADLSGFSAEQALGILVALRDAETRVELEEQLDVADRLTALSQLTRGVAHEIKNPLNAITLHLEVLRNRLGSEEAPEVDVIGREIARLNRIVKTFLDFHRPVDLHVGRLNLNELIFDVARLVEVEAAARSIQVHCIAAPVPVWVEADRDLLQQAMLNIVNNAIEAMDEGGQVLIRCSRQNGSCRVDVVDDGPGIAHNVLDKVFNLYFTTKQNGSGIGLAMSYRFVQLLNGRLSVTSDEGRGATFTIELPEAASEPEYMQSAHSQGRRS